MENDQCRIVSLSANNVMKLTAVHITPDKNVITLKGENGSGKSSVLNAIMFALGGKDAVVEQPIRKGQSKAEAVIRLSNGLIVTRRFTAGGTTLTVTTADGVPQKSPQGILDYLIGNLAFDPLEFSRMEGPKQLDTMRKLVGLDFSKLDQEKAKLYNDRTIVNRTIESAKNRLAALTYDETAPEEKVSVAELVQKKSAADKTNQDNQLVRQAVSNKSNEALQAQRSLDALTVQLSELQVKIDKAKTDLKSLNLELETQQQNAEKLRDEDTGSIVEQIKNAESINSKVEANNQYRTLKEELEDAQLESDELTAKIEKVEASKQAQLAAAKYPLPELSFNDSGVVYNGVPFDQASSGERLRTSVAVGMALNPKLRVIFIRDGSLLDNNGLKTISELADKNDYQVWLEDARSSDPTAIEIVDGHIKE